MLVNLAVKQIFRSNKVGRGRLLLIRRSTTKCPCHYLN